MVLSDTCFLGQFEQCFHLLSVDSLHFTVKVAERQHSEKEPPNTLMVISVCLFGILVISILVFGAGVLVPI